MDPMLIAIPLLVAAALFFAYGVCRTLVQLWAIHRRKVAILQHYEADPRAFASSEAVIEQISEQERRHVGALRQDYALTGTLLSALGLGALLVGRMLGYGQTAVGLYIGGITCLGLGVLVALLGYLIRALSRPLLTPSDPPR